MFDKLNKNQKIILYFLIGISFLFIIPIILWIGIFIGYQMCKNSVKVEVQSVLDSKDNKEKDSNYLEINL